MGFGFAESNGAVGREREGHTSQIQRIGTGRMKVLVALLVVALLIALVVGVIVLLGTGGAEDDVHMGVNAYLHDEDE